MLILVDFHFKLIEEMNDSQEYLENSDESCDSDNESGVPGVPLKKKTEKAKWTPEEVIALLMIAIFHE